MDFFKNLFGRGDHVIEIRGGRGGLAELLGEDMGEIGGRNEPLFFIKDHPEIQKIFKARKEEKQFLEKQAKAIVDQLEKGHLECWEKIETYMKNNGRWPKNHPLDKPICLKIRDGVMIHHVHE